MREIFKAKAATFSIQLKSSVFESSIKLSRGIKVLSLKDENWFEYNRYIKTPKDSSPGSIIGKLTVKVTNGNSHEHAYKYQFRTSSSNLW